MDGIYSLGVLLLKTLNALGLLRLLPCRLQGAPEGLRHGSPVGSHHDLLNEEAGQVGQAGIVAKASQMLGEGLVARPHRFRHH